MNKKMFGLGKGLGSLIPEGSKALEPAGQKENVFYVEIAKIEANPDQPRQDFDNDALKDLSLSIRKYGVLQPLLVSKMETQSAKGLDVTYKLIAGERRLRASKMAGLPHVPVIIRETQALPDRDEDDVYLPYKLPKLLQDGGVLYGLTGTGFWRQRNLPFEAGQAVGYGLTKEQALSMITMNNAKILGIDKTTGTLETGKDANLFISKGDALDMIGLDVETAFIQGRNINLDNLHKQLYKKFSDKYGLKL